jgi:hypothetical protein
MKNVFILSAASLSLMIVSQNSLKAQSVAINTDGTTPHTNAILDVKSTNKGMLAATYDFVTIVWITIQPVKA